MVAPRVIGVVVLGALGRMGSLLCATIERQDDLALVARVDPRPDPAVGDGQSAPAGGTASAAPLFATIGEALAAVAADVAVDFTLPGAVFDNVAATLGAGLPTVVGTTGLSDEQVERLSELAAARGAPLLIVPNFALGAVLLMQFAAQAARYFPAAEIIELHEAGKADAPSGTSLLTARLMTEAGAAHPHGAAESRPSRGLASGGVRIHSVRLPGMVAHQEVVFGGVGETLTIRHDSLARESFMTGALLAIRRSQSLEGTTVGLENLLLDTASGEDLGG
jgi:4-hydroxy-tetrahydrodipicolinate reductase